MLNVPDNAGDEEQLLALLDGDERAADRWLQQPDAPLLLLPLLLHSLQQHVKCSVRWADFGIGTTVCVRYGTVCANLICKTITVIFGHFVWFLSQILEVFKCSGHVHQTITHIRKGTNCLLFEIKYYYWVYTFRNFVRIPKI